jgi:hypothetical protein
MAHAKRQKEHSRASSCSLVGLVAASVRQGQIDAALQVFGTDKGILEGSTQNDVLLVTGASHHRAEPSPASLISLGIGRTRREGRGETCDEPLPGRGGMRVLEG